MIKCEYGPSVDCKYYGNPAFKNFCLACPSRKKKKKMNIFKKTCIQFIIAILAIVVIGIVGWYAIFGWSWIFYNWIVPALYPIMGNWVKIMLILPPMLIGCFIGLYIENIKQMKG